MKIDLTNINLNWLPSSLNWLSGSIGKKIEEKLRNEWDRGTLNFYKKICPNATIKVSPQKRIKHSAVVSKASEKTAKEEYTEKMSALYPHDKMNYSCDILNEQNEVIGLFEIIGDKIVIDVIKKK